MHCNTLYKESESKRADDFVNHAFLDSVARGRTDASHAFLDDLCDGVLLLNGRHEILWWNKAARRMAGPGGLGRGPMPAWLATGSSFLCTPEGYLVDLAYGVSPWAGVQTVLILKPHLKERPPF
jgi:PAS domain-containing protein